MAETPEEVEHRPLPSVGIPLLRDEVRASRVRRMVLLGVLGVAATGGLVAAVVTSRTVNDWIASFSEADAPLVEASPPDGAQAGDANDDALGAAATADAEAEAAEAARRAMEAEAEAAALVVEEAELPGGQGVRTVRRFGQSAGFRPALTTAGCSGEEADALIAALGDVMDFRRCRPSHELVFIREESGRLRQFEYHASNSQVYRARRDDEGTFVGSQVEIPVERTRVRRGGTVRASLGAALERAGLGRTLVGVIVEVFEREVNFNTQTRTGDTFRIIVEEERIAGEFQRYGTVHAVEVRGQRIGEHQAFWYTPRAGLADFYDASGRAVHGGWLRTPLRYDHISSPFDPHRRHPILRRVVPHNGIDYAAGTGTPVWAAADGVVTFVGPRGANGNLISLRHSNGYESHYAHLSRFASGLSRDDRVEQRQVIGYVGSTGRSTGPHLHFGLKRNGRFIDPQAELNGPGRMMPAGFLGRYRRRVRELQAELAAIPVAGAPGGAEAGDEPEPPEQPAPEPVD